MTLGPKLAPLRGLSVFHRKLFKNLWIVYPGERLWALGLLFLRLIFRSTFEEEFFRGHLFVEKHAYIRKELPKFSHVQLTYSAHLEALFIEFLRQQLRWGALLMVAPYWYQRGTPRTYIRPVTIYWHRRIAESVVMLSEREGSNYCQF